MHWVMQKKTLILITVIAIGAIFVLLTKMHEEESLRTSANLDSNLLETNATNASPEPSAQTSEAIHSEPMVFKVDVKGAIQQPGVYSMKEGDRIIDVVEKAGGFLETADLNQVNLSQKVSDEMVIYVPEIGEDIEANAVVSAAKPPVEGSQENGSIININEADVTMLQNLPGIGPGKAEAIIKYREENGPFQEVTDLMNVSGIGEKTFEKLKENISVQ
ncbi:helix-hairpin-helix domain-containing protein [Caldibacillus lycopersici]|uniref:Helix-hairpin-helix domain-containing protein n=1 Tax=Perspicuibacillus lycopersici TaxID=1325689 RepID=A0AAE3LQX5_9BACI|nr:helix-hairpin-helix domain-containing protein [Perspicuibacillus lycopersici]MCU9613944.1 helix-hairpin-helix domain-containing protein [Perspicuibacillus lycopersici]